MGVIRDSKVNKDGLETISEVRTNRLEDFLINSIGRFFGHKYEWDMVHRIEKRKLRNSETHKVSLTQLGTDNRVSIMVRAPKGTSYKDAVAIVKKGPA